MNERTKRYINEQREEIFSSLKNNFNLNVYEDEIAEDEEKELINSDSYNFFTLEFSDIRSTNNIKQLFQMFIVEYYSENRDDVDEKVIDVITLLKKIKGVTFDTTRKDRLQMKDTERYIDRVSIIFKRMIPIEC